jgi:hypothetical protein
VSSCRQEGSCGDVLRKEDGWLYVDSAGWGRSAPWLQSLGAASEVLERDPALRDTEHRIVGIACEAVKTQRSLKFGKAGASSRPCGIHYDLLIDYEVHSSTGRLAHECLSAHSKSSDSVLSGELVLQLLGTFEGEPSSVICV